jgi:thermopsin
MHKKQRNAGIFVHSFYLKVYEPMIKKIRINIYHIAMSMVIKYHAKLALSVIVALFMVLSALGVANAAPPQGSTGSTVNSSAASSATFSHSLGSPSAYGASQLNYVHHHRNISKYMFLPNMNPKIGFSDNHVQPLYSIAPAPMGIGYFGLINRNDRITGTVLNTPSFEGSVNITNMSAFNLGNDGPYSVTFQLNTVTYRTTLFGKSQYEFWTQNVIFYSTRTHTLQLVDNIWNFSSPTAEMTQNAIYSSTGQVIPVQGVHIALGPTFQIQYPFVVHLYNNLTVIDGRDTVFFNYSIPSISARGTYDEVQFNSTFGMPPGYSAPPTYYHVDGNKLAPNGLLYDAELMVGGPGGGSTNTMYQMDSTMTLQYLTTVVSPHSPPGPHALPLPPGQPGPAPPGSPSILSGPQPPTPPSPPGQAAFPGPSTQTVYVNVPSAYDFGTDTGETSEGTSVWWSASAVAHLMVGPSLLYGMWNISSSNSMMQFSGKVHPSNAFMFVSPGSTVSVSNAAWVPLSPSGSYDFVLPSGLYTAEFLMSYHDPVMQVLNSHLNASLRYDAGAGIYTPLMAFNNAQLANISVSGNGSSNNPYISMSHQFVLLSSLFSEFNDYTFPVFEGVMITGTSAHIDFQDMPAFLMNYGGIYGDEASVLGLPTSNYLGYWLYNVTNASIFGTSLITGWFSSFTSGFPLSNVLIWNSSGILVGDNSFQTMDSSMLIFGGTGNVVWGNTFMNASSVLINSTEMSMVQTYPAPLALSVYSSGNLIFNNIFNSTLTAYSPSVSIYTGLPAEYMDMWNVSLRPASQGMMVNGYNLSGSILSSSYQGGNYWWNFDGIIPYNNSGLIEYGGDYEPLNLLMIPYGPLVPAPLDAIVVVPVYAAYVSHNTTSTIVNSSVFFPYGSYSNITVSFFDQYISNPFDDSFVVQVNNTQILAGNTLELENTSVTLGVTDYYTIMQGPASVLVTSPQFNPGYSSRLSAWFTFYLGQEAAHPQNVISAFTDINFPTPSNAFPNNVPIPFNVTRSANVTFPDNITSAYINFYEQQNGNDEFWYTLQPPFREFRIFINNTLVATVEPYPNVQTGGGNLFLWQPILAIGAELYPPHVINLSPYLSLLHGKQQVRVEVINDESLWIRSALNFMINTTSSPVMSRTLTNSYLFVNSYMQNPPTNTTTESIPYNATYLNDSESVQEVLSSSGITVTNGYVAQYSNLKTDTFFSNATEYDPSFDILQKTSTGYILSSVENFYLNETITEYSSATYYLFNSSSPVSYGTISIINAKQEYFQINGTATTDYYLNNSFSLTAVGIGFNITQIRNITDYQNVTYDINGVSGGYSLFSHNNTMVTGSGFFVGTVVNNVITVLSYNHALTTKTVHSLSGLNGQVTHYYNLYEVAVNNSLILRNGQIIVYEVSQGI